MILETVKKQIPICPFRAGTNRRGICLFSRLPVLLLACNSIGSQTPDVRPSPSASSPVTAVVNNYCVSCHDNEVKKGGLDLDSLSHQDVARNADAWERVVRKLRARQMPPAGKKRPDERTYDAMVAELASSLDREAQKHPNPGRTETFRRLNRAEYQNAIRDLLALDIDAAALLPKDDVSHGFDNVTLGNLSPTLLDRYISVFFSSRRRHTRSDRDWSSDVCSSDLTNRRGRRPFPERPRNLFRFPQYNGRCPPPSAISSTRCAPCASPPYSWPWLCCRWPWEIGRASCRERV